MKGYPGWMNGEVKEMNEACAVKLVNNFPSSFVILNPPPELVKEPEPDSSDVIDKMSQKELYDLVEAKELEVGEYKKMKLADLKKAVKQALNKSMDGSANK